MIKTIALVSNVLITPNLTIMNEKSPMDKLLPLMHSNTLKINNKFCSKIALNGRKNTKIIETSAHEQVDKIHKGVLISQD
jgi:hypothetical protein